MPRLRLSKIRDSRFARISLTSGILLVLLIPSIYLAWTFRDVPQLGKVADEGIYCASAKSLANGSGYRILSLPGQPYQTKFPVLYPLALSLIWRINPHFPDNLALVTLFSWVLFVAYMLLAKLMFAELGFCGLTAWIPCALLALNPHILLFAITPLSEVMFSALVLGTLLLIGRATDESGARMAFFAGLLGGAAYLTRSAALPLILAGPAFFLLRKQYGRAMLFFSAMVPAILGWNLWVRSHLVPPTDTVSAFYTDYFGVYLQNLPGLHVPAVFSNNLACLLRAIGGLLIFIPDPVFWVMCGLAALGLASIFSTVRLAEEGGLKPYHLFAIGYCLMLLLWVYAPEERLLMPVFPLFLAAFLSDLRFIAKRLCRLEKSWRLWDCAARYLRPVALTVILVAVSYTAYFGIRFLIIDLRNRQDELRMDRSAYHWIRTNLPDEAAFISANDAAIYLHTGRKAISYQPPVRIYYRNNEAELREWVACMPSYAKAHGIQFVFANPHDTRANLPDGDRALIPVYRMGSSCIYHIGPEPDAAGAAPRR